MASTTAARASKPSTSRKSSSSAPGTTMRRQCLPPSSVRSTEPLAPLARATSASPAEIPRRRKSTPLSCGSTRTPPPALANADTQHSSKTTRQRFMARSGRTASRLARTQSRPVRLCRPPGSGQGQALLAHAQHRRFQRLLVVQALIDAGSVGSLEVPVAQVALAAGSFRDVFAGQLQVHAPKARAGRGVDVERLLDLAADVAEAAGLVAVAGRLGVAVQRVADPHTRTEERRVGKEGGSTGKSWWGPDH